MLDGVSFNVSLFYLKHLESRRGELRDIQA